MEQTCPVVAMGARALLDILQGVQYDIQAHEDCPEQVTEYLRAALFERPKQQFSEYARTLFAGVRYGFAPHEITLALEDGIVWLADLGYRPPSTIDIHTIKMLPSGWAECTQRYYGDEGMCQYARYGEPGQAGQGILLWPRYGESGGPLGEGFYRPLYALYEEWADAVRLRRIAVQKAGLGVFVFQAREGHQVDGAVIAETEEVIASAATHEKISLYLPDWIGERGWEFSDPESITAITAVIADIETRIMQCFGTQYAARGITSDHGSFASSKVDQDEMGGHRQTMVDWLSRQCQPLLDYLVTLNFGPQRYYPQIVGSVPREISPADLIASMASANGSDLLIVDSGIRASVRTALKQEPEGDEVEQLLAEKAERADAMKQLAVAGAGAEGSDDKGEDDDDNDDDDDDDEKKKAFSFARPAPRAGGMEQQQGPRGRELSTLERQVDWRKIEFTLDSSTDSLRGILMDGRQTVARHLVAQVKDGAWQTPAELARAVQAGSIPAKMRTRIEQAVLVELRHIADVATDTINSERAHQGDALEFAAAAYRGDEGTSSVMARQAAEEAVEDARQQLVKASISMSAPSLDELFALLERAADELSGVQAAATATMATAETFARARAARVHQLAATGDVPKHVWFSAILDHNTCDPCFDADQQYGQLTGTPIPWDSDLMAEMMPPYYRCLGGVRCRCQLIFEW